MSKPAAQVQARLDEMITIARRVIMPAEPGTECFACYRVPDARISLRIDGVEIAWLAACASHHETPARWSVESW